MTSSRWSRASGIQPDAEDVTRFTVCHGTNGVVQVTLIVAHPAGSRRMRVVMTAREARELAACITTPEPKVVR